MGQNQSGHILNTKGGNYESSRNQIPLFSSVITETDILQSNIDTLKNDYSYKDGKFGQKGKNCQIIISETPAESSQDFFDTLTKGMETQQLQNGKGWIATTSDGTIITYRPITSTPNSPAIDINTKKATKPTLKTQGSSKVLVIFDLKRKFHSLF